MPTKIRPPKSVLTAVAVSTISCLLVYVPVIVRQAWSKSPGGPSAMIIASLLFGVCFAVIIRGLYQGCNWLRWLVVVSGVFGVAGAPWYIALQP
jgi:hypothetical protein